VLGWTPLSAPALRSAAAHPSQQVARLDPEHVAQAIKRPAIYAPNRRIPPSYPVHRRHAQSRLLLEPIPSPHRVRGEWFRYEPIAEAIDQLIVDEDREP